MAKKDRNVFVCQECGYESPRWMGQCVCGAWNSFVEEKPIIQGDTRMRSQGKSKPVPLKNIGTLNYERMDTKIGELNRVLGGGMVRGSLVLISGEPGIGKSTLLIQVASNIATSGFRVLYVSGEESEEQIKLRADRVCKSLSDKLYILSETNMEAIEEACETIKPEFMILDSIQTVYSDSIESAPGSVSQVRVVGNRLMKLGKTDNIPVLIVAHVTKSGDLAGPKTVEHLVDAVLSFAGERDRELRILRAYKNRFGTTSEIGAFRMEQEGLTEVKDMSETFIETKDETAEGSVTTAIYEGSRTVMFEIQGLVSPANMGFPRRSGVGVDVNRLNMVLAVMEKKVGLRLSNHDVYVNVVGGMKPDGTGIDIAVALAIYSSYKRISPKKRTIALGEVGLTGDLRSVSNGEKIAREAARLGYERIILPQKNAEKIGNHIGDCLVIGVKNIKDAIKAFES